MLFSIKPVLPEERFTPIYLGCVFLSKYMEMDICRQDISLIIWHYCYCYMKSNPVLNVYVHENILIILQTICSFIFKNENWNMIECTNSRL